MMGRVYLLGLVLLVLAGCEDSGTASSPTLDGAIQDSGMSSPDDMAASDSTTPDLPRDADAPRPDLTPESDVGADDAAAPQDAGIQDSAVSLDQGAVADGGADRDSNVADGGADRDSNVADGGADRDSNVADGGAAQDSNVADMQMPSPDAGPEPECVVDGDCGAGRVCRDGACEAAPPECVVDGDCGAGRVCREGACEAAPPECVVDGDCGAGRVCRDGACEAAPPECVVDGDCGAGRVCRDGACEAAPPECVVDGDCGAGRVCRAGACEAAPPECVVDGDCGAGRVCREGACEAAPPECVVDGDCGAGRVCREGACEAAPPECVVDGDCGAGRVCREGACEAAPPECVVDGDCGAGRVCREGACEAAPPECVLDGDCGAGRVCRDGACEAAPPECIEAGDCASGVCVDGACQAPACDDGVLNGLETDLDCGGQCDACPVGRGCGGGQDCDSLSCEDGVCLAPRCDDGITNGTESGLDCGGACVPCAPGQACRGPADCSSEVCLAGLCQAPRCDDGIRNGTEADVDCGGNCASCSCRDDLVVPMNGPGEVVGDTQDGRQFEDAGCGTSGGAPEVVHRFSSPVGGVFCAHTAGSVFDTVLYARSACSDPSSELACNDAADYPETLTSQFEFVADPGDEVFIIVDGYSGPHSELPSAGAYRLTVEPGRCGGEPICDGDDACGVNERCDRGLCVTVPIPCAGFGECPADMRCDLQGDGGVCRLIGGALCDDDGVCGDERRCVNGECAEPPPRGSCRPERVVDIAPVGIVEGSTEAGDRTHSANCADTGDSPEVAHRVRVLEPTQLCVRTAGSDFDTVTYVRSDCAQVFAEMGCDDDAEDDDPSSQFSFFAFPDQDFFIFVDGNDAAENNSGDYVLELTEGPCPSCEVNPDCPAQQLCVDGQCVQAPSAGSFTITELTVQDGQLQVELNSGLDLPRLLSGCHLQAGAAQVSLDGVTLNPGAYRTVEINVILPAVRPSVQLVCGDVVVDEVPLGDPAFPMAASIALSDDLMSAEHNDDPRSWCEQPPSQGGANAHCDRCQSNPCPAANPPFCRGNSQITPVKVCQEIQGRPDVACVNDEETEVCAGLCVDGQCIRSPQQGDVIFTEIMAVPGAVGDANGEWIELHNPTDDLLSLVQCSLSDASFTNDIEVPSIQPGQYLVWARSLDPQVNGGVDAVGTFSFSLSNLGETLSLRCGDLLVDSVDFSGDGFNPRSGVSLALNRSTNDHVSNDLGRNWCEGEDPVQEGEGADLGSPGVANAVCDGCNPNPCNRQRPATCDGDQVRVFSPRGECRLDFGQPMCDYPSELQECPDGQVCENGECAVPIIGCRRDGCAVGQVCNEATAACEDAPLPGTCLAPIDLQWAPSDADALVVLGSTQGAANGIADASCGEGGPGPESVYRLNLPEDGTFCVSTDQGRFESDTVLHIRTDCADPDTELLPPDGYGCNDDVGDWDGDGDCDDIFGACRVTSEMEVNGSAGETYYVVVDGSQPDQAVNFTLSLTPGRCPLAPSPIECDVDLHCAEGEQCINGLCQAPLPADAACDPDRVVALDGPGRYQGSTAGLATLASDASCTDTDLQPERAHRIQFQNDTPVCVSTVGSSFDTVLSVRRANCAGNEVACNDDVTPDGPPQSKLEFNATAGVDYFILVDGWNLALPGFGDYVLTVSEGTCRNAPGPCAQEGNCPGSCVSPTVLNNFGEVEDTTLAAGAGIDVHECSNAVGPEAVFQLDLGYSGVVCLSTFGSEADYDTVLSVQRDCGVSASTLACNDDFNESTLRSEIELELVENDQPFVVLDSLNGGGDFIFSVIEGQCPQCRESSDCPGSLRCLDLRCIECQVDAECDPGLICANESCVFPPCDQDSDCAAGQVCDFGQCRLGDRGSCDQDVVIPVNGLGVFEGSTAGARASLEAGCASTAQSGEVVHAFSVAEDQAVCVSTEGSAFDTVAYVRTDCEVPGSELRCDDDDAPGDDLGARFTLNALANISYSIVVDGQDQNGEAQFGDYRLSLTAGACPQCEADDDCAAGRVCEAQQCIECREDADCPGAAQCLDNRCIEPPDICDDDRPCRATDIFDGTEGQDCDLNLGGEGEGICVDRGMCRNPVPFQIGELVGGNNIGREAVYTGECGGRGVGAEVIYTFQPQADGNVCLTMVDSDYGAILYLKNMCATNPAIFSMGFLRCVDLDVAAGLTYDVTAGETYFLVVDANDAGATGEFTFFSHYGACGALPPPECQQDADCALGQRCTAQRQCVTPIGTCEDPVEITSAGLYEASLATAQNQLDPNRCEVCVNPGGGRCGESVYRYRSPVGGQVCVTTEGSNYDTVLYVRQAVCDSDQAEISCSDDAEEGFGYSTLQFVAQANTDYFIVADAWSNAGRLRMNVTEGACP